MARAPLRRFVVAGRSWDVPAGTSLLEALARHGIPTLERSVRFRRPRAPFCGIGRCAGCPVRVNGQPGILACRYEVADGDRVATAPAWPSPRRDPLGALNALVSRAVGSFRGRRVPGPTATGPGTPSARDPGAPTAVASRSVDVDVAIVGNGRSGRAVAALLVARGMRPLLLDDDARRPELPGADRWAGAVVTDLAPSRSDLSSGFVLHGSLPWGPGFSVSARRVVIATGAYDASLLFAGNDRPGVLTGDGALALARSGPPPAFRSAVLVGGGERARELVDRLTVSVRAVVAPGEIGPDLVRSASELGIPLYPRTLLVEARGRPRVRSVDLRSRGTGERFALPCDAVVLGHRRLPEIALLVRAGAATAWDAGSASLRPIVGADGATSVPGLYVCGEAAGASEDGTKAGDERVAEALVVGSSATAASEPAPQEHRPSELERYYRELLRVPRRGRSIACRCEDVLLDEVVRAFERGSRGLESLGRSTRLGTGRCEGRYCVPDATVLLAVLERPRRVESGSVAPASTGPRR